MRNTSTYIGQDIILSKGSILENLTLNKKDISEDQVFKFFEMLNLNNLLKTLPNGLNSEITDNVTNFSGGEKQRLSIIRGLLQNKDWYFIDEITSALDETSSNKIINLFLNGKNKTIIMVAHKLNESIYSKFDKILNL
nr:ATP-binding cassette domain-containing protein [Spiroplasma gladiatoris]